MKLVRTTYLVAITLATTATAQTPPTCPAPPNSDQTTTLKDLPKPIREVLQARVKDIVDRDQPFDSTDVVRHGAHFNRFAFAWSRGNTSVIATERGGILYNTPVYRIHWPRPSNTANLLDTQQVRPATLCEAARKLLDSPLPAAKP